MTHDETMDYLKRHLEEYGNTVINTKGEYWKDELAKEGIYVSVREVGAYRNADGFSMPLVRGKHKVFYILEVL